MNRYDDHRPPVFILPSAYAVFVRRPGLLGGSKRFDLGLQTAGALALETGSMAARTLAMICSGCRPEVRSATRDAKTLHTSFAVRGARCAICVG